MKISQLFMRTGSSGSASSHLPLAAKGLQMDRTSTQVLNSTLLLLVLISPSLAMAQLTDPTPIATITMDDGALKADPRLSAIVSTHAQSISLKSLLDDWSEQSGIRINIDALDPSSGYLVSAHCSNVRLAAMLDSLYGLLSIRRGEWCWYREGKPGGYAYVLKETPWAKNRSDVYTALRDGLLRDYVRVMRKLAPMSPKERQLHRAELKHTLLDIDEARLNFYFNNESFWNQANFFIGALSESQQIAALSGQSVSVNLHELPEDVYNYYHLTHLHSKTQIQNPDGTYSDVPEPDSVSITSSLPNVRLGSLAPAIILSKGAHISTSWMGSGTLETAIRAAIERAWHLPADETGNVESATTLVGVVDKPKDKQDANLAQLEPTHLPENIQERMIRPDGATIQRYLMDLAQGASQSVLAILPRIRPSSWRSPSGMSVGQALDNIHKGNLDLMYKWRNSVILVNSPLWFATEQAPIPDYKMAILSLSSDGKAPIVRWSDFIQKISEGQADWLAEAYHIDAMRRLRGFLLWVGRNPRSLSKEGLRYDQLSREVSVAPSLPPGLSVSPLDANTRFRVIESISSLPNMAYEGRLQLMSPGTKLWRTAIVVGIPALQNGKHPDGPGV